MKRLAIVLPLILVFSLYAPFAEATCSGYHCRVGNCPWYELVIDEGFSQPSCNAWSYSGGAVASSGAMCSYTNEPYALLTYLGGFSHISTVQQTLTTHSDSGALDDYDFNYTIETDGMQSTDVITVKIIDLNTSISTTIDTFTGVDMWCNSVSKSLGSKPEWRGHQLKIQFQATLHDTTTTVKVMGVDLWQHVTT
jgi:hypothetical protein